LQEYAGPFPFFVVPILQTQLSGLGIHGLILQYKVYSTVYAAPCTHKSSLYTINRHYNLCATMTFTRVTGFNAMQTSVCEERHLRAE